MSPLTDANPLFAAISLDSLHGALLAMGIVGLAIVMLGARRPRRSDAGHRPRPTNDGTHG